MSTPRRVPLEYKRVPTSVSSSTVMALDWIPKKLQPFCLGNFPSSTSDLLFRGSLSSLEQTHEDLRFSSSYHPQTDGQSKIVNFAVLDLLKCYVSDNPAQWEHYLPLVEFPYNNTIHSSIGKAPFEIIVGSRKPPPMVKVMDNVFEADKFVEDLDLAYQQVQQTIQKAQKKHKKTADKHRRRLHFREGDWVLLRFEKARIRKQKGKDKFYPKLRMRYYGPFQISEVINDVSYTLSFPASWKIHNAFHLSLLQKFVGELPDQPEDSR
ncbi:hypothetical protein L7F22_024534 [Adiantum nelumboides]|nr:hypothetical protein [Adiantum nelumboides]